MLDSMVGRNRLVQTYKLEEMMKKEKRLYSMIALLAIVGMLFTACQPQIVEVEKEVIVEKVKRK